MAGHLRGAAENDAQMLHELQTLSRSLSRAQASRRAASIALPRPSNAIPAADGDGPQIGSRADLSDRRSQSSRRMSLSPWRSRQKPQHDLGGDCGRHPEAAEQKRGIWIWKPMRALAHLTMSRVACLFSVKVVAVRYLPAAVNGLRLSVAVRKKETKDGALQTIPSRVLQGCAEFEETLFLRCHLYCSGGAGTGRPIRFEPRPFLISVVAVDAPLLDLGTNFVDLSSLVKESVQKNLEGQRIRQWDTAFPLSGKATGGELVLKLAFQIMEDGGLGIYKQTEVTKSNKEEDSNVSISRIQPNPSFGPANPSTISANVGSIPRDSEATKDLKLEDFNLPEFDVIDIGIEIEERNEEEEVASEDATESSEVVKEVVHDRAQRSRLKEPHLIAREIKKLELTMGEAEKSTPQNKFQKLDSDEEIVTREFLQMLETEDSEESNSCSINVVCSLDLVERRSDEDDENSVLIPDLGKDLGIVVQTRDGGYLASMNPFNLQVSRKETPKLAIQISRELLLADEKLASGFDLLNKLAAMGSEQMSSKLLSLTAMDELVGKTAGQVAIEGIASAVLSGRKKEGASSSAARSIATLKNMAAAMNKGRKERLSTGVCRVNQEALTVDEILSHSLQKMEVMAIDALKVEAEVANEEAPFDAFPFIEHGESPNFLDSAIAPEGWPASCSSSNSRILLLVVIQLRDPIRDYEAVGAPMIAVMQAVAVDGDDGDGQVGEERRFNLTSLYVGGLKLSSNSKRRSVWDGEKQRLTAMQWLMENGLKAGRKVMKPQAKRIQDLIWSVSARTTSGVWSKHVRNPNLKVATSNSM